jgi:hypothetical protein
MNFVEAVQAATLGHTMRRPWRNNEDKHMFYQASTRTLKFSHRKWPYEEEIHKDGRFIGIQDLTSKFEPTVADMLATDWYIAEGLQP